MGWGLNCGYVVVDDAKMQRPGVDATTQAKLWITFVVFSFMYSGLGVVRVLWMYWSGEVGAGVKPSPWVWVLVEAIHPSRRLVPFGGLVGRLVGRSAQVYWSGQPGAGHQILDVAGFGAVCPAHRVHADFVLGRGKIGKKFWHRCQIWPPPRVRGGALRAGGRTHNAVYNPISTSISRFFFSYDTYFLFLSSDYQAHVNYVNFSFYYNDSKEIKNIYIYISREGKKSAFLTCAIFVPMDAPFWYKKEEPGVTIHIDTGDQHIFLALNEIWVDDEVEILSPRHRWPLVFEKTWVIPINFDPLNE